VAAAAAGWVRSMAPRSREWRPPDRIRPAAPARQWPVRARPDDPFGCWRRPVAGPAHLQLRSGPGRRRTPCGGEGDLALGHVHVRVSDRYDRGVEREAATGRPPQSVGFLSASV